ncbi:MAG TPA: nucleoside triphosphate pyrophosphohydrolase [Kofleriaceae bacterium]|nr:nucleoside triphosphate pyrophosphohydrolase [Kofleriaceae bacterium]
MTASDESWDRPGASLAGLCDIMRRLLAPDGCPWDREQTLESLRPYLIEEAYEVLEALETGTPADHCEELGDLLMNVVFQAALREQDGEFGIDDVVRGISDKLIRRHPHVFADAHAESSEEVLTQWEEIKRRERAQKERGRAAAAVPRTLAGVPLALPALARAQQVSARAARVGFDWPEVQGCRDKVDEELGELDRAVESGDRAAIEHELGDLLFAATSLARKLGCDAEAALRACTRRFTERFAYVEDHLRERGRTPSESNLAEMDALWDEAKAT